MAFIDSLLSMFEGMAPENIAVHEERCVCIRNRNAKCLKCVDVCTTGAIAYSAANKLEVFPEKCIGCGTCANACPTGALEVKGLGDDELTRLVKQSIRATSGHPVIACQCAYDAAMAQVEGDEPAKRGKRNKHPRLDDNAMCVVPCLGRIDESMAIGLGAYKCLDATFVCNDCEACEHAKGGEFVRQVLADSTRMLKAFDCDLPVTVTDEFPDRVWLQPEEAGYVPVECDLPGTSRRQAFKDARAAGADLAREGIDSALGVEKPKPVPVAYRKVNPETGTLSHFVPTRRTRMYNYLKHIGEPVADEVTTRVVGKIHIDKDACTACRMCAVFCPTGAIFKVDEPELFGIFHRPAACMQCRLCESLCHSQAITVESTIPIKQFMGKEGVLYEMEKPKWEPNRPDSMFNKIHSVIGEDLQMHAF